MGECMVRCTWVSVWLCVCGWIWLCIHGWVYGCVYMGECIIVYAWVSIWLCMLLLVYVECWLWFMMPVRTRCTGCVCDEWLINDIVVSSCKSPITARTCGAPRGLHWHKSRVSCSVWSSTWLEPFHGHWACGCYCISEAYVLQQFVFRICQPEGCVCVMRHISCDMGLIHGSKCQCMEHVNVLTLIIILMPWVFVCVCVSCTSFVCVCVCAFLCHL